jgi:hypothetical protein
MKCAILDIIKSQSQYGNSPLMFWRNYVKLVGYKIRFCLHHNINFQKDFRTNDENVY